MLVRYMLGRPVDTTGMVLKLALDAIDQPLNLDTSKIVS